MNKKFNTIKESIEHTLNNTVFPDSVIHYMAHGDKELIKQMKKQRDELTYQAKQYEKFIMVSTIQSGQ